MNGKIAGLRNPREGRSPAESRPGACRLFARERPLRGGRLMARRYRALSVRAVRGNAGGTAEGFAFRPQDWGGEAFFIVEGLVKWD